MESRAVVSGLRHPVDISMRMCQRSCHHGGSCLFWGREAAKSKMPPCKPYTTPTNSTSCHFQPGSARSENSVSTSPARASARASARATEAHNILYKTCIPIARTPFKKTAPWTVTCPSLHPPPGRHPARPILVNIFCIFNPFVKRTSFAESRDDRKVATKCLSLSSPRAAVSR